MRWWRGRGMRRSEVEKYAREREQGEKNEGNWE